MGGAHYQLMENNRSPQTISTFYNAQYYKLVNPHLCFISCVSSSAMFSSCLSQLRGVLQPAAWLTCSSPALSAPRAAGTREFSQPSVQEEGIMERVLSSLFCRTSAKKHKMNSERTESLSAPFLGIRLQFSLCSTESACVLI